MPYNKKHGLPLSKKSGVYSITNKINSKVYVGSALSIRGRLLYHRSYLRRGKHDNEYLQRAWIKYGEEAFRFDVLEICEPALCIVREQFWIDSLSVTDRAKGYNICPAAGSAMQGRKHSKETCDKMSANRKGKSLSKEALERAAEVTRGVPRSPEVKAKISAAHKGRKKSAEHVAKIKETHWSKRPDAAEIAARVVANRPQTLTPEHKAAIKAGHWKNRPDAAEISAKVSAKGHRKHSLESRLKRGESMRRRWREKRLRLAKGSLDNQPEEN